MPAASVSGPNAAPASRPGTAAPTNPPCMDTFPPLPTRPSTTPTGTAPNPAGRAASSRPPAALKGMVVEGGGKNSAYNIAQQGGRKDNRVFLRLAPDNEARQLSERSLCLKLNDSLSAAAAGAHIRIMQVKKTGGGLALTPGPRCKTEELFSFAEALERTVAADSSARHERYDKYVVVGVPTRDGDEEITMEEVRKNLEWTLDLKLMEDPRRLGTAEHLMSATSSPVIFSLAPNALASRRHAVTHVHLLGNRYRVRPYVEERAPAGCPRCLEYMGKHSEEQCSGPEQTASRTALERAAKKKRGAAQRAQPDSEGFTQVQTRSSRRLQEQQQQQQQRLDSPAATPVTPASSARPGNATTTGTAGGVPARVA
ncbi:hypothetical protein CF319_g3762 [Tilletia indica]|nr:hypothetical protein CF319_g3762 [Tilletia indica]